MATPRSIETVLTEFVCREQGLATKARIEALAEKARAFDEEHTAIVALQLEYENVQPDVLCKMLAYSARMRAFEAELAALDTDDINKIVGALGFPRA